MYPCTKCGLCCRNVNRHPIYGALDRGDGICQHLEESTNLCSIYDERPEFCRIDLAYELHFKSTISKENYYVLNARACNQLQLEAGVTGFAVEMIPK